MPPPHFENNLTVKILLEKCQTLLNITISTNIG
jgi:hypothetical protein